MLVTNADGTRVELRAEDVGANSADDTKDTFVEVARDFLIASRDGSGPRASGADGLRILEATMGAFESAATGRTIAVSLDRGDPIFAKVVLGVRELDLPEWSPVERRALYEPGDR